MLYELNAPKTSAPNLVSAASGYRIAKIDDTKFDDKSYGTYPTSTQEKLATDYSGFVGRVGLSFYLPTSSKQ